MGSARRILILSRRASEGGDSTDPDIRMALYGSTEDVGERRRQGHAVGGMLKRPHVRGLIVKVPRGHCRHVSVKGCQVLGAVVRLDQYGIPAAIATAA